MRDMILKMTITTQSRLLFEEASNILVGGVNSPVRAFKSVGGIPPFIQSGSGAYLTDEDGKVYIDYVLAFGPLFFGHANPVINQAISEAAQEGTSFGASTKWEMLLAKKIQTFFPSIQKIRFVNSGTESCMSAIRLARGYTKRPYILKFSGCYHGHTDSLLVAAGSGNLTLGKPDSEGVLEEFTRHTLVVPYNDIEGVMEAFITYGTKIAGVIVEPVCGNMGLIPPVPGFLETIDRKSVV